MIENTPSKIKKARHDCGLTQKQAASLVHVTLRTWQKWEEGFQKMHPAFWELFKLKTQQKYPARIN